MKQLKKNKGIEVLDRQSMIKIVGSIRSIEVIHGSSMEVNLSLYRKTPLVNGVTYANQENEDFLPANLRLG